MFEIAKADDTKVEIDCKEVKAVFDVAAGTVSAGLAVGEIYGAGEFEIGELTIRALAVGEGESAGVIYNVEIGGVHVGIIGGFEEKLDDLGVTEVLCTSSVRAVREQEPKLVISMGNIDGMTTELKLTARAEKRVKVKSLEALPVAQELVAIA